jgi:hypothetical protein
VTQTQQSHAKQFPVVKNRRAGGNPWCRKGARYCWIPACAGMTVQK